MTNKPTAADIAQVVSRLPSLAEKTGHSELYNIDVTESDSAPVRLIAGKYLRANNIDIEATCKAIEDTLVWRKGFQPRKAAYEEKHGNKFVGIGYNTVLGDDVVVWNIYGKIITTDSPWFTLGVINR